MRSRITGLAILALAAVSPGDLASARTGMPVVPETMAPIDFTAPQAAARAHLPAFFNAVFGDTGLSHQDAALRIALPRHDGRNELIWITNFSAQNDEFVGIDVSDPSRTLRFARAQIVDWSLVSASGRMYGNFATRMILTTIQPAQAEQIAQILTERPTPKEWSY